MLPIVFLFVFIVHVKRLGWFFSTLPIQIISTFIIIFLWFTYSLYAGYEQIGYIQNWAFYNKYTGLLALFGYFLTFSMVGFHLEKDRTDNLFLIGLLFAVFTVGFSSSKFIAVLFGGEFYSRFLGLNSNPNSYGFVLVIVYFCALSLVRLIEKRVCVMIPLISLLIFGIILSGSKSALIALVPAVLLLLFLERSLFKPVISTACVGACVSALFLLTWDYYNVGGPKIYVAHLTIDQFIPVDANHSSALHRWEQFERAFYMWLSRPVEGIGLGVFLNAEQLAGRHHVIHSTPLWLLTETGLIGLSLVTCLTLFFLQRCFLLLRSDLYKSWGILGICSIFFMIIFSIPTEALYQRYIWVIMGLIVGKSCCLERNCSEANDSKYRDQG